MSFIKKWQLVKQWFWVQQYYWRVQFQYDGIYNEATPLPYFEIVGGSIKYFSQGHTKTTYLNFNIEHVFNFKYVQ